MDLTEKYWLNRDFVVELLEQLPSRIFWKDLNGVYLGCNRSFATSLGLASPQEIVGKTDYDLPTTKEQSDAFRLDDQEVMTSRNPKLNIEEEQTLPDGRTITLLTNKVPLFNRDNNLVGILGIYSDVTDRKKLEEDIRAAKERAEAASQAKSEFIANMSHDIRTPITGILGLAESFKSRANTEEEKEESTLMIGAVKELLNLLNDILDTVRLEAGRYEDSTESFSIREIIGHNHSLLAPALKHKKLEFKTAINIPEDQEVFEGNKAYLDRAILNLISNAIKFTKTGYIKVTASFTPEQNPHGHTQLFIAVEDSGPGIPKDKQSFIFEHFSRLTSSYDGVYKGSGLGLYTVKKYIESMGGKIEVESEEGKGSIFKLTVPVKHVEKTKNKGKLFLNQKERATAVMKSDNKDRNNKPAILLVEDNRLAALAAKQVFERLNCNVSFATSGEEAIDKFQEMSTCDLIMMDIGLPGINGIEATRKIRKLPKSSKTDTPIIALTGHASTDKETECLAAGMQGVMQKPLMDDLAKEILDNLSSLSSGVPHKELEASEQLPTLDIENGTSLVGGDRETAIEALHLLAETLQDELDELKEMYDRADTDAMYKVIHRLYGGLCYAGAPMLRKLSLDFKNAILNKDSPEGTGKILTEILSEGSALLKAIDQISS